MNYKLMTDWNFLSRHGIEYCQKGGLRLITRLADLREGECAMIERLPDEMDQTLSRLGLVPGTEVRCLRRLPLGDPAVYRWRDIDVALRNRDASRIEVISKK